MNREHVVEISAKTGIFYKLEAIARAEDGSIISERVLADFFPNLVTNYGLVQRATGNIAQFSIAIGTGSTEPANDDTRLSAFFAGRTGTMSHGTGGTGGSGPWYGWSRCVATFPVGTFSNTIISEIGASAGGTAPTSSTDLISISLIKDIEGAPTTIELASNEELRVTAEWRFYAPQGDVVVQDTIGGVETDITIRACRAGASLRWQGASGFSSASGGVSTNNIDAGAYAVAGDAVLGAETSEPTGTFIANVSQGTYGLMQAHTGGTTYRDVTMGRNTGASETIGALVFLTPMGCYQVLYDPPVNKPSTYQFRSTIRMTIGRL